MAAAGFVGGGGSGVFPCCRAVSRAAMTQQSSQRSEMSQQDKWKGMFGRLRNNCKRSKRGYVTVRANISHSGAFFHSDLRVIL